MTATLTLLTCIGAGTMGGVFFAFSTFVMGALAQLPAPQAVTAMQRINVVVINPLFLGVFVGTALLAAGCCVAALSAWPAPGSPFRLAAGALYLAGAFAVTAACNVPRNDRLARLDPGSPEAAAHWPAYVREWSRWNHVRAVASIASAACAAWSLAP